MLLLAGSDQMLVLAGRHENLLAALNWGQKDTISRHLAATSGEDQVGGGRQNKACLRT